MKRREFLKGIIGIGVLSVVPVAEVSKLPKVRIWLDHTTNTIHAEGDGKMTVAEFYQEVGRLMRRSVNESLESP